MDELHLSETFQRYFSDIFLCCDEDKTGKATIQRTIDLVQSGNVPDDVISQIAEICWTPTTTNLNKKQFFSVLKLVAAHQANIPLTSLLLSTKLDVPLPRFTWAPLDSASPVHDLIELRSEDYTSDSWSTVSDADSETVRCSPDISSPASDSPTPTNSVQDRNWAWQGLVSEEQRQLLEEESSEKHSSDDEGEVSSEVWLITPEQRDYYTKQFRKLQDNTSALLSGAVARTFFERSHLPVHELRKIWQLADVTKDGALSLQEFFAAMHLVVLRKHKIPIPDLLPQSLQPQEAPPPKDVVKEWTKFVDSPTSSTVSSPGIKPVNFDFQIDQNDPDLRHPVARRLTPEMLQNDDDKRMLSAISRPQPKKINARGPGALPPPPEEGGPVSLPAFPPKKEPPPPPPRPFKTHGRSSSLDLNRLTKPLAPPTVPPRLSPKRLTNQRSEGDAATETFADFNKFEQYENFQEGIFPGDKYEAERKKLFKMIEGEGPKKHGAFEVYRKPGRPTPSPLDALEEEQWEEFERLQIENTALLRTCQELSQELAEAKEEKLRLKVKLERVDAILNGG